MAQNAAFVSPPIDTVDGGDPLGVGVAVSGNVCTCSLERQRPPPGPEDTTTELSLARKGRPQLKGVIDHLFYPHIIDAVLQSASWETLNAVRCTSRGFRDKVLLLQNPHVVFGLLPPPNVITSPLGRRIPGLQPLHDSDPRVEQSTRTASLLNGTRLIDIHGSPHQYGRSQNAVALAFGKRDLVLRFHPMHHGHDIHLPVSARKVVFFGSSMMSKWDSLPGPDVAQEKTIVNLKGLNNPGDLKTVFRRFPPAAANGGEAVLVFTHWGASMSYTVPSSLANMADPGRLARDRLSSLTTLVAGMLLGGWLFPNMPPVTFTIVDFHHVGGDEFALKCCDSVVDVLLASVTSTLHEMAGKGIEAESQISAAKGRLRLVTREQYAATLFPHDLELETVQIRHSYARRVSNSW